MQYPPSLRQVTVFLSVARHLHFTAAANELRMSQPAVTAQIRLLEDLLGVQLFDRTKREVILTVAGRELFPMMERIAADMADLVSASGDLAHGRRGLIRIAALPSVAASVLPAALAQFRATHPNVDVEVADVVADDVIDRVKSDQVDLGIGIRLTADRSLHHEPLMLDRLCVFCPDGHPLTLTGGAVTLEQCARFPMVLTKRNSSVRSILARATMKLEGGIIVALEANYMSTALGAVRAGLGIAILPAAACAAGSTQGLARVDIESADLTREIGMITHTNRTLLPVTKELMAALRRAATSDTGGMFEPL